MSLWKGKSKGTKSGYRIFIWILKNFGVLPGYFVLRFVVLYFFLFSYSSSKVLYAFYRHRLGFSRLASLRSIYRNYYKMGQSIIDKIVVMSGIKNRFSFHLDGEENLHHIASLKKGGILLSAHIGNWDIAAHLMKSLNTRINILIFDGEDEQIKQYLSGITGALPVNIIVIKEDLSHIYQLSEAFGRNELVCMHADRYLEGNKTMTVNFLGKEAKFPMGPFILASTFKVPVSYVFALKESNLHYHFFASKIIDYSHLEKGRLMQQMVIDYTREMESKVKQYPDQWFNHYDFWHR